MKQEKNIQLQRWNKVPWLAALFLLWLIGGVFAYWTQELTVHNEFETARYDTVLQEKFVSPDNWLPGEEIQKEVWVENKGTVPVFAKICIHQEWKRQKNITDLDGQIIAPEAGEAFPLTFGTDSSREYAAQIHWGAQVVLLGEGRDSEITLGLPVVNTPEEAAGKWILVNEKPDESGNYLLYYMGVVGKNSVSPLVVEAVTMNEKIQPAILGKETSYQKETGTWSTVAIRNETWDYECANYTMLVTAQTVQATSDAVKELFGTAEDCSEMVSWLAAQATDPAGW